MTKRNIFICSNGELRPVQSPQLLNHKKKGDYITHESAFHEPHIPLSSRGISQARGLASSLPETSRIYTCPAVATIQTAVVVANEWTTDEPTSIIVLSSFSDSSQRNDSLQSDDTNFVETTKKELIESSPSTIIPQESLADLLLRLQKEFLDLMNSTIENTVTLVLLPKLVQSLVHSLVPTFSAPNGIPFTSVVHLVWENSMATIMSFSETEHTKDAVGSMSALHIKEALHHQPTKMPTPRSGCLNFLQLFNAFFIQETRKPFQPIILQAVSRQEYRWEKLIALFRLFDEKKSNTIHVSTLGTLMTCFGKALNERHFIELCKDTKVLREDRIHYLELLQHVDSQNLKNKSIDFLANYRSVGTIDNSSKISGDKFVEEFIDLMHRRELHVSMHDVPHYGGLPTTKGHGINMGKERSRPPTAICFCT